MLTLTVLVAGITLTTGVYCYVTGYRPSFPEKPEKRRYMFEDENGNRVNPFSTPEKEETSDEQEEDCEYKYPVEAFD